VTRLTGFAPVIDRDARRLILGSFPGAASLSAGHYYAHPRNQFWPVMSALLGESFVDSPFEARYARLRAHRIALWDVLGACHRIGSLDSDIRAAEHNDFSRLRALAPDLTQVLFNGQAAGRFASRFEAAGYVVRVLPSTSPANARLRFEDKLALWRDAARWAEESA
jgi:hypoxanthine-DNA glycosylase